MKTQNKILTLTLLTLGLSTQSQARPLYNYSRCVEEYITELFTKSVLAPVCAPAKPLRLTWITQSYPKLSNNPHRVQIWEGSYTRTLTAKTTFLRELVDVCRGRVLEKDYFERLASQEIPFAVVNPNVDREISESFMLVPMTAAEASQELAEAQIRCEDFKLKN